VNNGHEALIQAIESDGYCVVRQAFDAGQVAAALESLERIANRTAYGENNAFSSLFESSDTWLWDLQRKDHDLLRNMLECEVFEEVLKHFLNDHWHRKIPQDRPNYILHSFVARSAGPKPLPIHIDSFIPYIGPHAVAMQVIVSLEAQNDENGCTVVVPKSHASGEYATPESRDRAVAIVTEPGDALIYDSRIWHGSNGNTTQRSRWSLIATFVRWWVKQGFNITQTLPQEIYAKLTPSQRAVLGFCSVPPSEAEEQIDTKTGYDSLKENVAAYRPSGDQP